jgi:ABC-type multidrug transport system ATPase subunit
MLFLDGPTSGLDAKSAKALTQTLKDLAAIGHAIAVVIHQPRTAIYSMLDNILLLSRGRMVYNGRASCARAPLESCDSVEKLSGFLRGAGDSHCSAD